MKYRHRASCRRSSVPAGGRLPGRFLPVNFRRAVRGNDQRWPKPKPSRLTQSEYLQVVEYSIWFNSSP